MKENKRESGSEKEKEIVRDRESRRDERERAKKSEKANHYRIEKKTEMYAGKTERF